MKQKIRQVGTDSVDVVHSIPAPRLERWNNKNLFRSQESLSSKGCLLLDLWNPPQKLNIDIYKSGQIITTSADVTLNGGLIRELPQNPRNIQV